MRVWGHRISGLSLLSLATILGALLLLVFFPPNGKEGAEWMQFLGRFHPLVVHFPIALILLVPILELAGFSYRYDYLHLAAGFVLGLATLGAMVAVLLGWLLAHSGGYSGPLVTQHMWGGIALAGACWLCWVLRARSRQTGTGLLYMVVLVGCVGLVGWTGYRGGQLTQGENHLTEYMPPALREGLGISNSSTTFAKTIPHTFYAERVEPVLATNCLKCHGADKQKGGLRLDSYGALMNGGKNGAAVKAGNAQGSDLVRRISLPPDNDDFMPKESKRPLSADQIKLIALWIDAGASGTLLPDAIKDAPGISEPTAGPAEVTFQEIDDAAVKKLRAEIGPALTKIQNQVPNVLEYESRGSADLLLNASALGSKFGDGDLAAMAAVAGHIVVADFSGTAITDRSATAIAAMKRLRILRLMHTKVTDATVQTLGTLDQLESLNVYDTPVTPAAMPAVAKLPKLAHFYAGQTAISEKSPLPQALTGKVVF